MSDMKRLEELAVGAARSGRIRYSHFIDPAEARDALVAANRAGCEVSFFGGYDDAERVIAAFWSSEAPESAPLVTLELSWNKKYATVGHRDLLGAVMGLGIERGATGDICLGTEPGTAYLFCEEGMADYVCGALEEAGRASLRRRVVHEVSIAPPVGTRIHATVQSLRLDSVIAAGYHLSRSEAQRLITAGLVKLDHAPEERSDVAVREGSLLSVRGYGRLRVEQVNGETRKGRIGLELFRYGK